MKENRFCELWFPSDRRKFGNGERLHYVGGGQSRLPQSGSASARREEGVSEQGSEMLGIAFFVPQRINR